MDTEWKSGTELLSLNTIRVETALSRYPVHRLARKGDIRIEVCEGNRETALHWKVSHNSAYGQPGPLAYKLDTLIINRRIEEAFRPIPRLIKLGSLHDICKELGVSEGKNKSAIKQALYQNASAFITAKIHYKTGDGSERVLESGFTRYSVIFTGEKLPDGRKSDGVYVLLNDVFIQVINGAMTRPLDYDYLKSLSPAPQRFYELLSYQMYAALKHDRPRAKLIYSELCDHAPMTRHLEWGRARSQMNKIHRPHLESGYIAKFDSQQTADCDGKVDWIMLYQPGPKARAEFKTFTKRGGPSVVEIEPLPPDPQQLLLDAPQTSPLEAELIARGITPATAAVLVRQHDAERITTQIEILDWMEVKKPGKITDTAAWLVIAIKNGHAIPKGFESRAIRQKREEAKQAKERESAEIRRRKHQEEAKSRKEDALVSGYWNGLSTEQKAAHDAAAIAQADAEELKLIEPGPMKRFGMTLLRDSYTRKLLQSQGKLPLPQE
jgi:hypothetical protein